MKIRFLLFCLLFTASSVFAEGFYTELSVGQARQKTDIHAADSYSADDISMGVQIGYQFLPYMAVELGYYDYGKATKRRGLVRSSMDTSAINTGLKFILPLGDWVALYAKTGIAWWDYEHKATLRNKVSKKGRDFYYGAGAKFNLNEIFAIGLEYQGFSFDVDANTLDAKHKVDHIALTLSVLF